jgi:hypothetical protein
LPRTVDFDEHFIDKLIGIFQRPELDWKQREEYIRPGQAFPHCVDNMAQLVMPPSRRPCATVQCYD